MQTPWLKPLWVEGLFLAQQHLQQWDAYWHDQLNNCCLQFSPYSWGVQQLVLDQAKLMTGELVIKRLVAIFANGEMIVIDDEVSMPLRYQIAEHHQSEMIVHLCLSQQESANGISGYENTAGIPKYTAQYKTLRDSYDSERQREVLLGPVKCILR